MSVQLDGDYMGQNITRNLEQQLKQSNNLSDYLQKNQEHLVNTSVSTILNSLIQKSQLKKSEIIKQSGITTSYAYEILNGFKVPTRDKVLRFLIAMKLEFEEIQVLLKRSGYPTLYIRNKRDSIIIYAITNQLSVIEANIMMDNHGVELI